MSGHHPPKARAMLTVSSQTGPLLAPFPACQLPTGLCPVSTTPVTAYPCLRGGEGGH